MAAGMEYKLDAAGYVAYVAVTFNEIDFSGAHTLLVREAAEGTNPASDAITLTFTTNQLIMNFSGSSITMNSVTGGLSGSYSVVGNSGTNYVTEYLQGGSIDFSGNSDVLALA